MSNVDFKPYPLDGLAAGLMVRHPVEGWPVWMPVVGIRVTLRTADASAMARGVSAVYRQFLEHFAGSLTWSRGPQSKSRKRVRHAADLPVLPDGPAAAWDLDVSGLGDEKGQAFALSFRSFGMRDPWGAQIGAVRIAVPIEWLLAQRERFDALVAAVADLPGLQVGGAGLCGAGTPDHASPWRAPEFLLLSTYLGLDPSEDAGVSGTDRAEAGHGHSAQWIAFLGPEALARLGGAGAFEAAAVSRGMMVVSNVRATVVRSSALPDPGYREAPPGLRALDALIAPNRAANYFVGQAFATGCAAVFGLPWGEAGAAWMRRFEDRSVWGSLPRRHSGFTIEAGPTGPVVVPF